MIDIFDVAPQAVAQFLGLIPQDMALSNAQQAQSAQQLAHYDSSQSNSLVSLTGLHSAVRPTVRQISDWECERLGPTCFGGHAVSQYRSEFTFSNLIVYAFFLGVWSAVIVLWMGWIR